MIFRSKFIIFGFFLSSISTGAHANSCKDPLLFYPEATSIDANQEFVRILFERFHSNDPSHFIVYGQFQRSDERPLIHEIEHTERMERWRANNWEEREVFAGIEYTYLNLFRFDGVRIIDGEERQFSALKTIISVGIDGEFIRGRMPPSGKSVIGLMWEADPIYYRIDNSSCEGYIEITDEQYEMLRTCISANGCKP